MHDCPGTTVFCVVGGMDRRYDQAARRGQAEVRSAARTRWFTLETIYLSLVCTTRPPRAAATAIALGTPQPRRLRAWAARRSP